MGRYGGHPEISNLCGKMMVRPGGLGYAMVR